jgi:hypothetical protein
MDRSVNNGSSFCVGRKAPVGSRRGSHPDAVPVRRALIGAGRGIVQHSGDAVGAGCALKHEIHTAARQRIGTRLVALLCAEHRRGLRQAATSEGQQNRKRSGLLGNHSHSPVLRQVGLFARTEDLPGRKTCMEFGAVTNG